MTFCLKIVVAVQLYGVYVFDALGLNYLYIFNAKMYEFRFCERTPKILNVMIYKFVNLSRCHVPAKTFCPAL